MTGADPFVVPVARLRRAPGTEAHEVRRGPVALAGPLSEVGIDPGRSVVPAGADAECEVTLRADGAVITAVGTVRAPWEGVCRRCAVAVGGELVIAVHERFAEAVPAGGADGADGADDEPYPVVDDRIDLGPLVRDAIVLEVPAAPLCRPGCLGLCPHCGGDRNEGECGCVAPPDPRWANLDVLR
ncbi:MAG: YceD family protein [Acidimicrobiales bacterium]